MRWPLLGKCCEYYPQGDNIQIEVMNCLINNYAWIGISSHRGNILFRNWDKFLFCNSKAGLLLSSINPSRVQTNTFKFIIFNNASYIELKRAFFSYYPILAHFCLEFLWRRHHLLEILSRFKTIALTKNYFFAIFLPADWRTSRQLIIIKRRSDFA